MGSKINPTMIGAFVVGAVVFVVAGALLFGGGKFSQNKLPYVLFFDSSVEGLNVGAPVIFRGVQVGQVSVVLSRECARRASTLARAEAQTVPRVHDGAGTCQRAGVRAPCAVRAQWTAWAPANIASPCRGG